MRKLLIQITILSIVFCSCSRKEFCREDFLIKYFRNGELANECWSTICKDGLYIYPFQDYFDNIQFNQIVFIKSKEDYYLHGKTSLERKIMAFIIVIYSQESSRDKLLNQFEYFCDKHTDIDRVILDGERVVIIDALGDLAIVDEVENYLFSNFHNGLIYCK